MVQDCTVIYVYIGRMISYQIIPVGVHLTESVDIQLPDNTFKIMWAITGHNDPKLLWKNYLNKQKRISFHSRPFRVIRSEPNLVMKVERILLFHWRKQTNYELTLSSLILAWTEINFPDCLSPSSLHFTFVVF